MSRSNPTLDEMVDEVKAAMIRMAQIEGLMTNAMEWRNQSIRQLRHYLPAAEIGRRVGLTRQTIYSVLKGDPIPSEELDRQELPDLIHRLSEAGKQLQDVAIGRSAMADPNPVGWQMLSDNLRMAVDWLEAIGFQETRLRDRTEQLKGEWWGYEMRRNDDGIKSRQFPHLQDLIVHQLVGMWGSRQTAALLEIPYQQVIDAVNRPGLDGKTAVDVDMDGLLASGQQGLRHPEGS